MPTFPRQLVALSLASGIWHLASHPSTHAEEFRRHVVVAQESRGADVGRDILRAGGNAVDAAVATAFALAVTHPAAGNLGGGGFAVIHLAEKRQVTTIDFREAAPAAATPTMYLDESGRERDGHRLGPRAAGVPGTVRGLGLMHRKYGRLPWQQVVEPAIRLARDGFPVSGPLARSLNSQLFDASRPLNPADDLGAGRNRLAAFPSSVAAYRKPDGSPWREADTLTQPDLAATLERIAGQGPDEFYVGRTAALIADYCRDHDGLITRDDLASYRAVERPPVHTRFRGLDVFGMGPPSSGGTVVALMLAQLDDAQLAAPDDPTTLHRITEAMRRAYLVRALTLSDPRTLPVPASILTSPALVAALRASTTDHATPSADLAPFPIIDDRGEGPQTTHLSALDADGNAVALTYTLEEGYGSKAVVPGAGFLLNNEMGDFNLTPGRTDAAGRIGTRPNRIAPRKRMLSSQSPTIVLDAAGRVRLVTGSPGGRTIPNTVLWVLLRVLMFEQTPEAAVLGPRTHHAWLPDRLLLEGDSWPEAALDALRARGHAVGRLPIQGDAHTIVVDPETRAIHGVADPRHLQSKAAGD
jgi:gamma-glutamyltranspeptidase/glutathione hydrolase